MPHTCPPWFCFSFDNPLRRLIHDPWKILAPYVAPGDAALDLGPGKGYFTVTLARLVGKAGRVIAADVHPAMLKAVEKRVARAGLAERLRTHLASPDGIGLNQAFDFALLFWMLHEIPTRGRVLAEIRDSLSPRGRMLVVEPRLHVKEDAFAALRDEIREAGFILEAQPKIALSRSALFRRGR
jgi:ubiquinone/menaquinone biosynthesis C-methylase UbiE